MIKYEVGKPFPGVCPKAEGVVMEIGLGGGWYVFCQFPGLTAKEKKAFQKSFDRYSFLDSGLPVPIPIWVFDFPPPFNMIDVNFDARIVPADRIEAFLTPENGRVKNLLTFFLLDGEILKAQKIVGLGPEAVGLFHTTIRKQLASDYSPEDYGRYLTGLMSYTSAELFEMGRSFRHKK